jgi:hypothetical protein|nr:MAG TPA: Head Tail Connector Protein [Caudoviricetes sp.]
MDKTTVLSLVKSRLNRLQSDTSMDDYLLVLIDAAEEELKRTGITIREESADDAFLLTNLAVWRYQNRDSAGAMPPWLAQYRRERWLAERTVHEDAP